jgi:FkbM family methyltransferase
MIKFGRGRSSEPGERQVEMMWPRSGDDRPVIYLGDHTALTRLRSGHKIYVDTRDVGIASHLMLDGIWETWVENALIPEIKPGMTFYDIGANFGYYTLLGARAVGPNGRVFAFECNPRLNKLLRQSVMVNGLAGMTTVIANAVSDRAGTVKLTTDLEFSGGGTTLPASPTSQWTREQIEVPCAPLDELAPPESPANVIKIDVEGAEPLVFAGADRVLSNRTLGTIVFEFYAPTISLSQPPAAFLERVASYGFSLQAITPDGVQTAMTPAALLESIGKQMTYVIGRR